MSDTKEVNAEGEQKIKIKCISELKAVSFGAKLNARLRKLKKLYSKEVGAPVGSLRFLYNGLRIDDEDTPGQLGMEDGDVIEVYVEQTGGF